MGGGPSAWKHAEYILILTASELLIRAVTESRMRAEVPMCVRHACSRRLLKLPMSVSSLVGDAIAIAPARAQLGGGGSEAGERSEERLLALNSLFACCWRGGTTVPSVAFLKLVISPYTRGERGKKVSIT